MTATITPITEARLARYIEAALQGFLTDPAASEFQRGYLACLLLLRREGLGKSGEGWVASLEDMAREPVFYEDE